MTKINFKDITTKEELLTRITEDGQGKKTLSVGNKWSLIKDFFSKEKEEGREEVKISYTAGAGKHQIWRYL